jgi:hypothetical protein
MASFNTRAHSPCPEDVTRPAAAAGLPVVGALPPA